MKSGLPGVAWPRQCRRGFNGVLPGTLLVLLVLLPFLSASAPLRDEAAEFFSSGVIPTIQIQVHRTNMARLSRNPRDYVRATVREGERVYEEVGIHLKGAAGSFRSVNDSKPAFTLNFDKFVDRQHFHGIDKLALNNSVQDPSYITEELCGDLFLAAGVPTPRTTHARVQFNGRDCGLYVLKEGFDKTFLRRHFKNVKGNLYDGGFLNEITQPLERTSGDGDVPNRRDLKALAEAAQTPDRTERMARLEQVLDVERFITFSVLEMLTWHWDGYTLKRNNYRLYHDPDSGRIVFFPHGMDQMFWDANQRVIPTAGQTEGLVARAILQTAEGQRRYRQMAAALVTNVFTAERLTNQIRQIQARIRPVLGAIDPQSAKEHDRAVANLINQVNQRVLRARQLLAEPEPESLALNASGVGRLVDWHPLDLRGTGQLERSTLPSGMKTLHIQAGSNGRCTASWRTRILLPPGEYLFIGRVRTAGITPLATDVATKGVGAGIRQSRHQVRQHGLVGDTEWQTVEYPFTVSEEQTDVSLLCELRAEKGEAWFDLSSLNVRRKTPEVSAPAP